MVLAFFDSGTCLKAAWGKSLTSFKQTYLQFLSVARVSGTRGRLEDTCTGVCHLRQPSGLFLVVNLHAGLLPAVGQVPQQSLPFLDDGRLVFLDTTTSHDPW